MPAVMPVVAAAQTPDETVTTQNASTGEGEAADTTTTDDNTTGDDTESAKREERIAKYKEKLTERLTTVEERKLKTACKGAQTITAKLGENVGQVRKIREDAYTKITDKLNVLVEKLNLASVDTTALDAAVTDFDVQVETFLMAVDDYQTTLDDLSALDCETDPTAFKAALSAAKEERVYLVSSSQSLRLYFNDNIKPILIEIKQQLSGESEDESTGSPDFTESETSTGEGQ